MLKELNRKTLLVCFLFAFAVKLFSVWYLATLTSCTVPHVIKGHLASYAGDAPSYLTPIDNYLKYGEYFVLYDSIKVTMGRAPYYGIPYYCFRQFLNQPRSYDAVILLQILMEALSIIFYSKLLYDITKKKFCFWTAYGLFLVSLNSTFWSYALLTESLHISLFGIFSYFYFHYLNEKKVGNLVYASIALALIVLLKPYFALFYILIGIEILYTRKSSRIFRDGIILSIPLILLVTPYTIRNFVRFNTFMPFSEYYSGYAYTKANFAYRDFITAWGGSYIYWDKHSAGCYFEPQPNLPCDFEFPQNAFCSGYTMDDLSDVHDLYIRYQQTPNPALEDSVANSFRRLTRIYRSGDKIGYYVISPLLLLKQFLFHSGSYYLPIKSSSSCYRSYQMLIKLSQTLLYYLCLFAGLAGLFLMFLHNRKTYLFMIIPLFLILFFPLTTRDAETRFFDTAYPFLVIGTVFLVYYFSRFISRKENG